MSRLRYLPLSLAILTALGVNAVFAGSSWPQAGYDAQGTNFNRVEKGLSARTVRSLHVAWTVPGVTAAVASSSAVYSVTPSTSAGGTPGVTVLNPITGAMIRQFSARDLGLQEKVIDAPQTLAVAGSRLIVASSTAVLAMNGSTGKVYWRVQGGADGLVVSGRRLYTGKGCQNACGALVSQGIDIPTGRLLWSHSGNFGHAPAVIGGHLYQTWGEYKGHTSVYDPASGHLLATMPLYATWTGDANHTYAYVTRGQSLSSMRASLREIGPDGRARWTTDVGRAGDGVLVYAYKTVYSGSYRFSPGLVAVNAATGKVRWAANLGRYLHLTAANHLLVAANDQTGQISVLDAGSGKVLRQLSLPSRSSAVSGLMVAGRTIYVTSAAGLTALRP